MGSTGTRPHRRATGLVGLVAASALLLGACSDDDGDDGNGDDTFENPTTEGADIRSTEAEPDPPTEGVGGGVADEDDDDGGAVDTGDGDGVDGSTGAGGATETEGGAVGTTEG